MDNVVSAFDGFGREISLRKGKEIHFQSLSGARRNILEAFGFDFSDVLAPNDWEYISRMFQKRHLLSHKMGVIDEDYVQKANDPGATVGRKITVTRDEVETSIRPVELLGKRLFDGILPPTS